MTHLPYHSGGSFDAAGDFDALLGSADLPLLGSLDPFEDSTLHADQVTALITDLDRALDQSQAGRRGAA